MMGRRLKISFLLLLFGFLASCEEDILCTSIYTSWFKVSFFKVTEFEGEQLVEADSIHFFRVYALTERDSLFALDSVLTSLFLVVDPNVESTTFVLESFNENDELEFDTLVVDYNKRQRLLSEECGPEQLYVDFEVNASTYDSAIVLNDELLVENDDVVQVYN